MPCPAYNDQRLAACYDFRQSDGPRGRFLSRARRRAPRRFSTWSRHGRLAIELAERGHRVTGADPSAR